MTEIQRLRELAMHKAQAEENAQTQAASDWFNFPDSYCRKCNAKNSAVFLAPVFVEGIDARTGQKHPSGVGSHICLDCATEQNWIDARTGNLRPSVTL